MTQNESLIAYFRAGHSITQLEALNRFGIGRLASRINDLKRKGFNITKVMVEVEKADGTTARVARYALKGENK